MTDQGERPKPPRPGGSTALPSQPPFDLYGAQCDARLREEALSKYVGRTAAIATLVAMAFIAFFFKDALNAHRTMMTTNRIEETSPFANKIALKLIKRETIQELESFFVKTRAKKGFNFLTMLVKVENRADQTFVLNPYAFRVMSVSGKRYQLHVGWRKLDNALSSQRLGPGEDVTGQILFEIPIAERLEYLEMSVGFGSEVQTAL